MIGPDGAQHGRDVGARVAVGVLGVMHEGEADGAVPGAVARGRGHPLGPCRSRDDRRLARPGCERRGGERQRGEVRRVGAATAGPRRSAGPRRAWVRRRAARGRGRGRSRADRPSVPRRTPPDRDRGQTPRRWPRRAAGRRGADRAHGQPRRRGRAPVNADEVERSGGAHAMDAGSEVAERHREHAWTVSGGGGGRGGPHGCARQPPRARPTQPGRRAGSAGSAADRSSPHRTPGRAARSATEAERGRAGGLAASAPRRRSAGGPGCDQRPMLTSTPPSVEFAVDACGGRGAPAWGGASERRRPLAAAEPGRRPIPSR